jgi:hypothetical protein
LILDEIEVHRKDSAQSWKFRATCKKFVGIIIIMYCVFVEWNSFNFKETILSVRSSLLCVLLIPKIKKEILRSTFFQKKELTKDFFMIQIGF